MPSIVSNGNVGLSTANGFYKTAARNPWTSGTLVVVTNVAATGTTIAFTPDDTGNALGAFVCISAAVGVPVDRSFVVELQQNIATVWTTVDSKTLTATEISNFATARAGEWIVPFTFTAGTVTLTTAASTWRLRCYGTGGTTGNWYMETSDGTNPFFAVWTNTATSFASGDCVWAKYPDIVTLDATTTLGPVFGTGVTNRAAAMICSRSNDVANQPHTFAWDTAAARTVSIDGFILACTSGGVRFGTSASPITFANQGVLSFLSPSGGGSAGGYRVAGNGTISQGAYLEIYGQVPTYQRTTLASNANSGQAHIITAVDTSAGAVSPWIIGDTIYVGKRDAAGITDVAARTISNISTTDITLSSNLTQTALAGASVVRTNGYGFKITSASATVGVTMQQGNSLILSGVQNDKVLFYGLQALITTYQETSTTIKQHLIQDVSYVPFGTSSTNNPFFSGYGVNSQGLKFNRVNAIGSGTLYNTPYSAGITGTLIYTNNVHIGGTITSIVQQSFKSGYLGVIDCEDNTWENINSSPNIYMCGVGSTYKNNTAYGCTGGWAYVDTLINPVEISGNKTDRSAYHLSLAATTFGARETNPLLGTITANTTDVNFVTGAYIQYEMFSPTGAVAVSVTNLPNTINGTRFAVTDYNDTTNDDRNWLTYGYIVRTGTSLTDTTVHTAGGFGVRFQPTSSTSRLEWEQTIPTGNIQTKTMMVGVWCKINNAAYWAGTHQMPRLTIDYDNGTTAYAEAAQSTDWQLLFVPITPTTTYGQITATLSGMTDATTTNAYIYFDDYSVLFPAGVQLNLGSLDLWAGGLPIVPTIATNISAQDVWTVATSTLTGSGTIGKLMTKVLTVAKFLGLK